MYKRFPKERSQENGKQGAETRGPWRWTLGRGPLIAEPGWCQASTSTPRPPTWPCLPHLLTCHGSHLGHQGLNTLLKEEQGEVAVSRSDHTRLKQGVAIGLHSGIQGLFQPVSFYGEPHERWWKEAEKGVKGQPTAAGCERQLAILESCDESEISPKDLGGNRRGYMDHSPLQQPEARLPRGRRLSLQLTALWEVPFSCPRPGREGGKTAEHCSWRFSRERTTLQRRVSLWKKTHRSGQVTQSRGKRARFRDRGFHYNHSPSSWSLGSHPMPASISELLTDAIPIRSYTLPDLPLHFAWVFPYFNSC